MISYFLDLVNLLKTKNTYNLVEEYKNSTFNTIMFDNLKADLDVNKSILNNDGLYSQTFNNKINIKWSNIKGIKIIKEVKTNEYSILTGLKTFIIKISYGAIKELRFDLKSGVILKINFIKSYFINFVDFFTGKVSMGLIGVNIKELFKKNKLSELTESEWELLTLNSAI